MTRTLKPLLRTCAAALAVAAAASPGTAQQGGIELYAAETLFATGTRTSISYLWERRRDLYNGSSTIPDPLNQSLLEQRMVAAVDHGLRADLTVSALLPYVNKQFESDLGNVSTSGVGDATVLGKYRYYKDDWRRGAFHLAAIGGLEMPTGVTDAEGNGTRAIPQLQPGSGSWDPFFALSANLNMDRVRLDSLAFYKWNTEGAQDFEAGDFFSFEVKGAYRFLHQKYPGDSASARVAVQWRQQAKDELDGTALGNSGSRAVLVRPGLGWHPRPGIDLTISVDFPVYQDVNGTQLGLDARIFAAAGMRF